MIKWTTHRPSHHLRKAILPVLIEIGVLENRHSGMGFRKVSYLPSNSPRDAAFLLGGLSLLRVAHNLLGYCQPHDKEDLIAYGYL